MSINTSPEVLSAAGFKNLASKAELKRNLSKEDFAEVQATAKDEIARLKDALTTTDVAKKNSVLEEYMPDISTRSALLDLIKEVENTGPVILVNTNYNLKKQEPEKLKWLSQDIINAAGHARAWVNAAFWKPGDANYKEYISLLQQVVAKVPGYEPSSQKDISDAIHQSREFNLAFISWLEWEAAKDTNSFDTSAKWSGMYSFLWEKTTFVSVEEKRSVITAMLKWLWDTLSKPEVQAGMIESFLGEWFLKKAVITVGGTVVLGVAAGVLIWKWGTWILTKTLWTAGSAIAWAIATWAKKGWSGSASTVSRAAHWDGLKWRAARAATWAATGLVIDITTGMPGVATTIWTISWAMRWKPILGWTPPAALASIVAYRELDITKISEKTVHNGIIEEIYKSQNAWVSPTPDQAKSLSESIRSGFASSNEIAEYQSRVSKYLSLTEPSLSDPKKIAEYRANVERAIKWEKDPSKWNLSAKSAVKWAIPANETAFRTRMTTIINDARSEKVIIGGVETEVRVWAKTPIEEMKNISDQIDEKKAKLEELQKSEKILKQRLALEWEYGKIQVRVTTLPALISAAETALSAAEINRDTHNSSFLVPLDPKKSTGKQIIDIGSRDADPSYLRDRAIADKAKSDLAKLILERDTTLPNKLSQIESNLRGITGKWSSNIARYGQAGIIFDASGNITNSKTLQKLNNTTSATVEWWVKEKIAQVKVDIATLEWQLNSKLITLNSLDPTIPTTWNKTSTSIGTERFTTLGAFIEGLIKKLKK